MDREGGGGGSMESCYYSVLGVRKEASLADIRFAYRKLALEWHPDRWTMKPLLAEEAKRQFQKIQEAYSVLSDHGRRSMYDAGVLDLLDDEDDEGMGDFLHDLMNMMDKNVGNEQQESLEDLQKTFVEMFGDDLANFMENDQGQSSKKRTHVKMQSNPTMSSKRTTLRG